MGDVDEQAAWSFERRLREARELRGQSQAELAEAASLPSSSISHFEGGGRKPSFDNLKRLAGALDVSTDFLLGRTDRPDALGAADELRGQLANLSSSDLDAATKFIGFLAQRGASRP